MIRVSVLYPAGAGDTFDLSYYCEKHMALARRLLGAALKGVSVDAGIAGGEIGAPAPYLAIGHLMFESLDAFLAAFLPVAAQLQGDIPNYTNAAPIIQISEMKL
jgi:uncharacterized protein (TIGR02118 family)